MHKMFANGIRGTFGRSAGAPHCFYSYVRGALLLLIWLKIALPAFAAGSPSGVVEAWNNPVAQVWDPDSGLPDSSVTSLVQTPDGYIWIGTGHGGIARFDGRQFLRFAPGNTPDLKSIEIHKLVTDAHGVLWIGDVEGGLISYQNGRFSYEHSNPEIPKSVLENLLSDRGNQVSFSTMGGLVYRFAPLTSG